MGRRGYVGSDLWAKIDRRRKMSEQHKTNAVRTLERMKIPYDTREYEVDPDDLSAEHVAASVEMPLEQVFKTLVCRGDKTGVFFAVLAGSQELDLKAVAKLSGNKKADVVPLKEVQPLTGYIRGGCTAIAAKKAYPVFVDESMLAFPEIAVSAGVRGMQLLLAPADYIKATRATTGPIAHGAS